MRAFVTAILSGAVLVLGAAEARANPCEFRADRTVDIDPAGMKTLAFELGSSDLHVEGVAGLARIEVRGKACASQESWLAELTVDQARNGDRVTVKPHQREHQTFSLFGSSYAYIDLEVRVPKNLPIEVRSHSGDAQISDVAALDFASHSGDLILHRVAGNVVVDVDSGDVRADDIGDLSVHHAGSGDIQAHDVHGGVTVGQVGSGDLGFRDVSKGVHVDSIGSGDLNVSHAGGDVAVGSIGSGDISVGEIGGDLTVRAVGSGDIRHHGVAGRVQLPQRDR